MKISIRDADLKKRFLCNYWLGQSIISFAMNYAIMICEESADVFMKLFGKFLGTVFSRKWVTSPPEALLYEHSISPSIVL